MKRRLLIIAAIAMLALGLTACGKPATVEEFYSRELYKAAMEEQITQLEETYADTYSDIGYSLSGNTFTYTYTYKMQIDDTAGLKKNLESALTQDAVDDSITALEEETGITGVSVQYIYYNADGTEIYNQTFSH